MSTEEFRARCLKGLDEALERIDTARLTHQDPLIPLTESLAWLYTLKEWHQRKLGSNAALFSAANFTAEGETFQAVIWARGKNAHAHGDVAELVTVNSPTLDATLDSVISGAVTRWHWVKTADLPKRPDNSKAASLYERHVAGQDLMTPLRLADSFVRGLV